MRIGNSKIKKLGAMGLAAIAGTLVWSAGSVYAVDGWGIDLNSGGATASSVTLTLGGTGNVTLAPQQAGRTSGIVRRTISATIGASDGHTIKISGNPDLTGKNAANKILGVTANRTLAQMDNQWGWYSADGDVSCSDAASYKAMSASGATVSSGTLVSETKKTITLCFGAKVNESQAADTYSNTIMISAVAQPKTIVTFGGITTMQEMTPAICKAASENDTAYLRDTRDNKSYWVTKMLDGNCWMSQNLALDLGSTVTATYNDNPTQTFTWNVESNGGMASIGQVGIDNAKYQYAWSLGKYVIIDPAKLGACDNTSVGLSACSKLFVNVESRTPSTDPNFYKNNGNNTYTDTEYDAHYLVGNYYQWNAAVAGTGVKNNSPLWGQRASGSICPKNWKLPNTTYGSVAADSFAELLQRYGLASGSNVGTSSVNNNTYDIAKSPFFFGRSGTISATSHNLYYIGREISYWSSQAASNDVEAYFLSFRDSAVYLAEANNRYSGRAVRCLVPAS